ncbi:MAG TPA: long-chain fatty acid--CoA ligase [Amycolatopsis sp.]|uniref:class I adenylate-forming enzyme family protein n=1 Tax=Amycolatopsis sp. TaxID=37632 RepID=UPI002B471F81|nr:long-chain fatty acid--CoA ligase [Amycolatopsis sp.]HKS47003.1 long-chain fatty acid--CoA ligase [Amycolatopsis sp.]
MHLATLVEMIESGYPDRVLVGGGPGMPLDGSDIGDTVRRGATTLAGYSSVVYVGENQARLPCLVLSAVWAGVPFVPLNYRLEDSALQCLIAAQDNSVVIADRRSASRLGQRATIIDDWLRGLTTSPPRHEPADNPDEVAILLHTSGTISAPKAALLRHRHLMAYLLGSVEFGSAGPDEAALVAVPPYHVAGMANMLSNLYAGRRLVYLPRFSAESWLRTARAEGITHAMVVPTMLARIVDHLGGATAELPALRSLSYGGAKVSERVIRDALAAFPDTDFVNAYGLTETASTIAVLGPDDHRAAVAAEAPEIARRLASAGRVLPTVDVEIRDEAGEAVPLGVRGILHVRGDQISGEYATGSLLDAGGWFCTRDQAMVDEDGFLFIDGRADDTIIRGGENIAPAEIEEVLLGHPLVAGACVVGIPDEVWGQRILAAVVPASGATLTAEEIQSTVRERLRGSKTPDLVVFRESLPHTETGKLLRRVVAAEVAATKPSLVQS